MRQIRGNALAVATLLVWSSVAAFGVNPGQRTADMPDSWLVLYNLNHPDSVAWVEWYRQQWGIPADHTVGLSASLDEHLPDLATVQAQIITPVRTLLATNSELNQSIMGILLGYALPGSYANPPLNPTIGGFSVSDALQDMSDDGLAPASQKGTNYDNPHMGGQVLPPGGRVTRASMAANRYMVARIDAPSLVDAMSLTQRAQELRNPQVSLYLQSVWFDYWDPLFPSGNHEWYWLRQAVQNPLLADLPWSQFDLDAPDPQTPDDAFRFHIYRLNGWNDGSLNTPMAGGRVLGFDFNSWGAVTVRSTTANGGLYVPNAIVAGWAAGVGATGEPQCCVGPFPDTLLAALREGWTLGEAFYLANPFNDWMWTLVADPFLTLPNWFDEPQAAPGDINGDGELNSQDLAAFAACVAGPDGSADPVCDTFDLDGDGDPDLNDFAILQGVLRGSVLTPPTPDFDTDGDVDLADFESFTECWGGLGPSSLGAGCSVFDSNFDLDVDLMDVAFFNPSVTSSWVLP